MKILMTRLDDLRNELRESEPFYNQQDEEIQNYRNATNRAEAAFNAILQDAIKSLGVHSLVADVDVYVGHQNRCSIMFNCENKLNALRWTYVIIYDADTKTVKSSSNSWSGLDATGPEAIDQLRESADLVEYLQNEDWNSICEEILSQQPQWGDYVKTRTTGHRDPSDIREDIDKEELFESIRQNMNRPVNEVTSDGRRYSNMYLFVKETPKKFQYYEFPGYVTLENYKREMQYYDPYYIKKEYIFDLFERGSKVVPVE